MASNAARCAAVEKTWEILAEAEPHQLRAELLRRLSRQLSEGASEAEGAFGRHGTASAASYREQARMAAVVAEVERAQGAADARRPSDWKELEEVAGSFLDQLARTDFGDDAQRAAVYGVIESRVLVLGCDDAARGVVARLREWHEEREEESWA